MDQSAFTHRFNSEAGVVESICHRCFATIASATVEADLQTSEQRHTCCPENHLRLELLASARQDAPS